MTLSCMKFISFENHAQWYCEAQLEIASTSTFISLWAGIIVTDRVIILLQGKQSSVTQVLKKEGVLAIVWVHQICVTSEGPLAQKIRNHRHCKLVP